MDILPSSNVSIETLVTLGFLLLLGIYVIFTGVLYYHWQTYGADKKITTLTLGVYFATTIPLLLVMAISMLLL